MVESRCQLIGKNVKKTMKNKDMKKSNIQTKVAIKIKTLV